MDFVDQLNRFLNPIKTRVRNMVTRGVIKLVYDNNKIQKMQNSLLAGETKDGIEHYMQYGFTSVPHPGMETLVVFCNGDRSNGVIVAVGDRKFRLKPLQQGEVALYTDEGDYIKLGRQRNISINTLHLNVTATEDVNFNTKKFNVVASDSVNITSPQINTTGNITSAAEVSDADGTMSAIRGVFNPHVHPGDSGGQTGGPTTQM